MNLLQALKQAEHETSRDGPDTPTYPTLDFPVQAELPTSTASFAPIAQVQPSRELPFFRAAPDSAVVEPVRKQPETVPTSINAESTRPTGSSIRITARIQPKHRLTLCLGLIACSLLAAMGAWFWWPMPVSAASATPPASVHMEKTAPSPAATPEDLEEENQPLPATSPMALQSPAMHALPTPSRQQLARSGKDSKVVDIEPQPTPKNLPQIERNQADTAIPAELNAGWQAWQQGDFASAQTHYRRMLDKVPHNRDALLGLAAIAARQQKMGQAIQIYRHLLTLNPQDEATRTALLLIQPEAMSEASEAKLLQQAEPKHSPQILAQYYAAHQRWHEAQEQYFRAFVQAPNNADLAYNLAISLDHLRQNKRATEYYRRALTLEHGSFERTAAVQRLAKLDEAQP